MSRWFVILSSLLSFLIGSTAFAADIYINGQLVRGITDLSLENCKVSFSSNGDVHIEAPGFKVLDTPATGDLSKQNVVPAGPMKYRYFLFASTSAPGSVPYSFEVAVNGQVVKVFSSRHESVVQEITLYMKPGPNEVIIKRKYEPDKIGTEYDKYEIKVGRGTPQNDSLEINEIFFTFTYLGNGNGDGEDKATVEGK